MNRENIQKVRDLIASLPPEQVNMGVLAEEKPDCGTVACIAGWAYRIKARDFGLSDDADYRLTQPLNWYSDRGRSDDKRLYPKARVLATLDHLLATGKVSWSAGQ